MGSQKNLKQKSNDSKRAKSFREFVNEIEEEGILKVVKKVPLKELPTVFSYSLQTPFKFTEIEGLDMTVVGNIFSTKDLVAKYFGVDKKELLAKLVHAIENPSDPTEVLPSQAPVLQNTKYPASQAPHLQNILYSSISNNVSPIPSHTFIEKTNGTINAAIMLGIPPSVPLISALVVGLDLTCDPLKTANTLMPINTVKLSNGISVPADAEIVLEGTIIAGIGKYGKPIEQEDVNLKNIESVVMEINKIHYRNVALLYLPTSSELALLSTFVREVLMFFGMVMDLPSINGDMHKYWN